MNRREFLSQSAMLAALIGVSVKVTGCGSDDPAAPAPGNGDVTGTASIDHTHSGTITKAQLDAAMAVNITFSGSGHTHSLPLTAPEVIDIAMGTRVQKDFTDFQHRHIYTFN